MLLKQLTQKVKKAKPVSFYKPGRIIRARNTTYKLSKPYGKIRDGRFAPQLTPQQMLEKGVFEGRYINNDTAEYPREWYEAALARKKLSPEKADEQINMFKIKSRLPLSQWRLNGWVSSTSVEHPSRHLETRIPSSKRVTRRRQYDILSSSKNPDTKGWFQWYCRYFIGRRLPELDTVQKKRWIAFTRHAGAVRKNCTAGNLQCRPRQRQALLQWAYRPTI